MSKWFRFYNEALDDPKVQLLSGDEFKLWVNLLCLASRNGGRIHVTEAVAFSLRVTLQNLTENVTTLTSRGLLDRLSSVNNGSDFEYEPHNWGKRQYKSDTSTERVERFRERQRNVSETPPEYRVQIKKESSPFPENSEASDSALALDAWNETAKRCGLPEVKKLTDARRRKLAARLKADGLTGWVSVLAKIDASPFLRGENDRGWRADFDFVLSESNYAKITEGKYDRRQTGPPKAMRRDAYGQPIS